MSMEHKKFFVDVELKALADDEEGMFEGYASTFGNIDSTGDIIEAGAFKKTIKQREPKVLWQHDMDKPVGKVVDIREDDKGLYVKVKLAIKTTLGRDAYEYMKADIVNRLSIGFRTVKADYEHDTGLRTIKEVELFEFSLVTIPANDMAEITGIKQALPTTEREFEKFLRENGFSQKDAKSVTAYGIKGYLDNHRDDGKQNTPVSSHRDDDEVEKILSTLTNILKGENHARFGYERSNRKD